MLTQKRKHQAWDPSDAEEWRQRLLSSCLELWGLEDRGSWIWVLGQLRLHTVSQHPKSVGRRHSRPVDTVLHRLKHEEQEFKTSLRHTKSIKQKNVQFLPYDFNLVNLPFLVQIPNLPDSSGPKAGLELCAQDCPLTHNLTLASYQWAVSRVRKDCSATIMH